MLRDESGHQLSVGQGNDEVQRVQQVAMKTNLKKSIKNITI